MSTNLDLVRSICANWERGEFRSTAWMHPDIEIVWSRWISPVTTKGVGEAVELFRDEVLSTLEAATFETEEIREVDTERVLVLARRSGHGKRSGLELGEMRSKAAVLFHVRDRKVTTLVWYWDRDRALIDLGLMREGDSR